MNFYKALGALFLITGLIVGLFMAPNPDNVPGGLPSYLVALWLPLLCVFGGLALFIKGFFWSPPTKRRGSASSSKNSSKNSGKKSSSKSRKKKK